MNTNIILVNDCCYVNSNTIPNYRCSSIVGGIKMGYKQMKNLACYVATNLCDWGKQDIEDMVEQVGEDNIFEEPKSEERLRYKNIMRARKASK